MDGLDLDIENYDLTDLLNLFKLNIEFTENDLKMAKIIALKTHPDKSKLDKKFFLFFMKAYGRVEQIYNFRKKPIKIIRYLIPMFLVGFSLALPLYLYDTHKTN